MKLSEQYAMSECSSKCGVHIMKRNLMKRHISFWHDSACPDTAHLTIRKTEKFGWKCSHILPTVRTWPLHINHLLGSSKHHKRASTTKTIWQSSKSCIHSCKIHKQISRTQRNLKLVQHWQKDSDHCGDFMEQSQDILFLYMNLCFNVKQVCS
jgi:imidazoleglycerol phosphate dehydratase HisB